MKQAIVARTDIGMSPGKLAAQVAHAAITAYERTSSEDATRWRDSGQKKIVLAADGESAIFDIAAAAKRDGLPYAVIRDAGHTQLEPGTVTAIAIGPASETEIDRITGDLSLL